MGKKPDSPDSGEKYGIRYIILWFTISGEDYVSSSDELNQVYVFESLSQPIRAQMHSHFDFVN